jgi:hypothetical protein
MNRYTFESHRALMGLYMQLCSERGITPTDHTFVVFIACGGAAVGRNVERVTRLLAKGLTLAQIKRGVR